MDTHRDNQKENKQASESHQENLKKHTEKSKKLKGQNKEQESDKTLLDHLTNPERLQDEDHKMNKRLNDVEGEVTYNQDGTQKDSKKDDDDKGTE